MPLRLRVKTTVKHRSITDSSSPGHSSTEWASPYSTCQNLCQGTEFGGGGLFGAWAMWHSLCSPPTPSLDSSQHGSFAGCGLPSLHPAMPHKVLDGSSEICTPVTHQEATEARQIHSPLVSSQLDPLCPGPPSLYQERDQVKSPK